LLGGVTAGECWRVMLAFIAMLLFTLTAGVLVSAVVSNPLTAFIATALLVLAMTVPAIALSYLPGVVAPEKFVWLAGPLEVFLGMPDSAFSTNPSVFWRATVVSGILCTTMFLTACFLIERFPNLEVKQTETWWQRWLRP